MGAREGTFVRLSGSARGAVSAFHRWGGKLNWALYLPAIVPDEVYVACVERWGRDAITATLEARPGGAPGAPRVLGAELFVGPRDGGGGGYLHAFARPPYGLRGVPLPPGEPATREAAFDAALRTFDQINDRLLGEVSDANLVALRWDTEWSRSFINEWWDYLYTVWSRSRRQLVVIWGTATD